MAGAPGPGKEDARVERIEVVPGAAVLKPKDSLPVLVRARYSDGRTETVTQVLGELVRWRNDVGFTFAQLRNPMLPRIEWEREGRRGESVLDAMPDLLWPLQAGATAEFLARRRVIEAGGSRHDFVQRWRCRVEAPAMIEVPAGQFEAWPLSCERHDDLGQLREERRWWYAPSVAHVVAAEEVRDGVSSRRELIAWRRFQPTPAASADETFSLLQQALETLVSGQELGWTSPDGGRRISIAPVRTFQREALYCRDYRVSSLVDGKTSVEEGTACRGPDAIWRRAVQTSTD